MTSSIAYISVGSNLGERADNCRQGIATLAALDGVKLLTQSRLFLTEPENYEDQDWFVNAMAKIETTLAPMELLKQLKAIEVAAGRTTPKIRYGPRILDLDIIFYDDIILDSKDLQIPHPQMHKRQFVLQPFCDIDPDITHPVLKKSVQQLSDALFSTTDMESKKVLVYK